MQEQHPSVDELTAFSAGKVEEGALTSVQGHIAHCSHCRSVLNSLPPDEMTKLLREAVALPDPSGFIAHPPLPVVDADLPPALADHPRYRLLSKIGSGGMGDVFLAEHRIMKRLVAVKVISPALLTRPAAVTRFRREVEAVAQLSHPNIASAFDADEVEGRLLLVTEFVQGADLAQVVKEKGPLPIAQACEYVRQAALGLQHAHDCGIVHRDIKPSNLMRTPERTIKVLDFGLASLLTDTEEDAPATPGDEPPSSGDSLTDFGQAVGTLDFVAPEQLRDSHTADARADIYSLGCTLHFLLAGKPPFPEADNKQKIVAHLERLPQPLSEIRVDVPAELSRLVERLLAKQPDQRVQTMTQVATALTPFAAVQAGAPRNLARRFLFASVILVVGVLVFGTYRALVREGEPPKATEVRQFVGHQGVVRQIAVSPDAKHLLSASFDGTVRLWEIETGKLLRTFEGHTNHVLAVAFSPDGKRALSGSSDNTMRLWDFKTGQEERSFVGHTAGVHAVAFSPDGTQAASGGLDSTVRHWSLSNGEKVASLKGHRSGVHSVLYMQDGKHLISASNDTTIRLWDIEGKKEVRCLTGHTGPIMGIALSPDGKRLVSGSHDETVRTWDMASGKETDRLDAGMHVTCVAVAPDGRRVLFGGWQDDKVQELKLWDLKSKKIMCRCSGHTGRVSSGTFLPGGRQTVSSGEDRTIRLWRVPK